VVTVSNVAGGPIIQQIPGGTANAVVFVFDPPAAASGTPAVNVPAMVGGPAYTIEASGASSDSSIVGPVAIAHWVDGGQRLGTAAAQSGLVSTEFLSPQGIYVGTSLALNVVAGQFTGVAYWLDDWHGGEN
jgi:hypothetical protein